MKRAFSLVVGGLVAMGVGGCGSCGQGSHATEDTTEDAGPSVVQVARDSDGGRPIRIRRNVTVIHVDGGAPP